MQNLSFSGRLRRLAHDMRRQGRRLRLQQTAASLAFLSLFAAVPMFSIVFSVLTALPVFGRLRDDLQRFLSGNLFPEAFSETVIDYLNLFANRASGLSLAGACVFFLTAFAALRVIERTMNDIWATSRRRSIWRRLALYWMLLTFGPLALGAGLALNGLVMSDLLYAPELGWLRSLWFLALPWLLSVFGLQLLFQLLPGVRVRFSHALMGALVSASLLALLQRGLGWYVRQLPTYEVVYGAFAALPLLLIWLFFGWSAVLSGALLASNLRRWEAPAEEGAFDEMPGQRFSDAWLAMRAMGGTSAEFSLTAMPVGQLRTVFEADTQRAEQTAELLDQLGYIIRYVNLSEVLFAQRAGSTGRIEGVPGQGAGARRLSGEVWAERWVWARAPGDMSLRTLFDALWWGRPADSALRFPADWLDLPLDRSLRG